MILSDDLRGCLDKLTNKFTNGRHRNFESLANARESAEIIEVNNEEDITEFELFCDFCTFYQKMNKLEKLINVKNMKND